MKKIVVLFAVILFFTISNIADAQPRTVYSGSLHFTFNNSRGKVIKTIKIDGNQYVEERDVNNLLLLNLYPGEYYVTVEYFFRNSMRITQDRVFVQDGTRIYVSMDERNNLIFRNSPDESSVMLPINNSNSPHNPHIIHHNQGNEPISPLPVIEEPIPISQQELNEIIRTIDEDSFNKMQILKSVTDFHPYFLANQVKQLADLFTFESEKLECVKYLAVKVIDRQNLPHLSSVFTHSSTKTEYLNFLNTLK